jgi:NAD-dependent SIR2 family protein deacetylase
MDLVKPPIQQHGIIIQVRCASCGASAWEISLLPNAACHEKLRCSECYAITHVVYRLSKNILFIRIPEKLEVYAEQTEESKQLDRIHFKTMLYSKMQNFNSSSIPNLDDILNSLK